MPSSPPSQPCGARALGALACLAPVGAYLIRNKDSGKFHLPGCRDVSKMSAANKLEVTATRDEMLEWGYVPCMHCNP
ncbi:MAG: hypothetical protein Q4C36_09030 [Coriobacteriia bacterium]|nr:hypothetical protein [Coriobacteriia bacterium]